jgi:hypothetical protein
MYLFCSQMSLKRIGEDPSEGKVDVFEYLIGNT